MTAPECLRTCLAETSKLSAVGKKSTAPRVQCSHLAAVVFQILHMDESNSIRLHVARFLFLYEADIYFSALLLCYSLLFNLHSSFTSTLFIFFPLHSALFSTSTSPSLQVPLSFFLFSLSFNGFKGFEAFGLSPSGNLCRCDSKLESDSFLSNNFFFLCRRARQGDRSRQ